MWPNQNSPVVNDSVNMYWSLCEPKIYESPPYHQFHNRVTTAESTMTQNDDEPLNLSIKPSSSISCSSERVTDELPESTPAKRPKYSPDEYQAPVIADRPAKIKFFRPFSTDSESSDSSPPSPSPQVQWPQPDVGERDDTQCERRSVYSSTPFEPFYAAPQTTNDTHHPLYGSRTVQQNEYAITYAGVSYEPERTSIDSQAIASTSKHQTFRYYEQSSQPEVSTHSIEQPDASANGSGNLKHVESCFPTEKVATLESYYPLLEVISLEDQIKIAEQLDLSHVRVQTWFRNRSTTLDTPPKKKDVESLLELYYKITKFVSRPNVIKLGEILKMNEVQVALWFRNRRSKDGIVEERSTKHGVTPKRSKSSYIHGRPTKK